MFGSDQFEQTEQLIRLTNMAQSWRNIEKYDMILTQYKTIKVPILLNHQEDYKTY